MCALPLLRVWLGPAVAWVSWPSAADPQSPGTASSGRTSELSDNYTHTTIDYRNCSVKNMILWQWDCLLWVTLRCGMAAYGLNSTHCLRHLCVWALVSAGIHHHLSKTSCGKNKCTNTLVTIQPMALKQGENERWDYLRTTNFIPAEICGPVFEVKVKACQLFLQGAYQKQFNGLIMLSKTPWEGFYGIAAV